MRIEIADWIAASNSLKKVSLCMNTYISERGLIFTVHGDPGTRYAHLRHLPIMPYYENFRGQVPGIGFRNTFMHFLSVDIEYKEKRILLYDSYYRYVTTLPAYKTCTQSQIDQW